jgi:hypothetical protein
MTKANADVCRIVFALVKTAIGKVAQFSAHFAACFAASPFGETCFALAKLETQPCFALAKLETQPCFALAKLETQPCFALANEQTGKLYGGTDEV